MSGFIETTPVEESTPEVEATAVETEATEAPAEDDAA